MIDVIRTPAFKERSCFNRAACDSRDETAYKGNPIDQASPFAEATPIRKPV